MPNIEAILPAPLVAGAQGATLKIVGENFDTGSKVLWNGSELSTTVVDSNTLSSPVESANLAVPGVVQLAVKNTLSGQTSPAFKVAVNAGATANAVSITTPSLPTGTVHSAYSASFTASGGTYPYTWSLGSGSKLPAGISLNASTGTLAGTPTAAGSYSFSVVASDANRSQSKSTSYTIVIQELPLSIANSALANATAGSSYSQTLSASGGSPNYRWSISSGSLPAGLSLNSPKGIISGTPTASGAYSFVVAVKDSTSPAQTAAKPLTISVAGAAVAPLQISTGSIPAGTSGQAYSTTLTATGGKAPYTWSFTSGSLPSGLLLSSAGVLSGTTSIAGAFPFVASVSDTSGQTKSVSLSLTISATPLKVATSSLPSATKGSNYSQALQANGGTPGYKWSISAGSLPPGLTLNQTTGAISGTPTTTTASTFTAMATDSTNPTQTATAPLSISVVASPLAVSTPSLPSLSVGTAYSQQLQATGGTNPYTWSLASGSLPPGLTLSPSGAISGSISSASSSYTYSFSVKAQDASSPVQTASAPASISVTATATPLSITNSGLSSGTVNVGYTTTLQAVGGTPAYTWRISSGALPAGLVLSGTSGLISGTPTAAGTTNFTATVSDNGNPVQSQSISTSITVAAGTQSSGPTGPGTFWYIRTDGGTRYSANQPNGQCDGKADSAYPGSGTNQHCAFSDFRYLWDDQSYGNNGWVIAGGDTVILRGGPWRIGFDSNTGSGAGYTWCYGGNGPYSCINPTIPSGTATQHTRILGENYANCSVGNAVDKSKLTQVFGGYGVWSALNLTGLQYVDVQCLDITSHAQCMIHGSPAIPRSCNTGFGPSMDDYDSEGILTDINTRDLLLQDVFIHGHTDRGIKGPIGGVVTCLRCDIFANGMAGWDFDDGNSTPSAASAVWNFKYSSISWSGCNQVYPNTGVDTCYSQSSGGYGDGVGTPVGMCLTANIDHSQFNYNTQDGLDLGHGDTGNCALTITNSVAIGNSGGTFKSGPNENPYVFENNLAEANCLRLSKPMAGTSSYFNAHLSDFCRAQDAVSLNFRQGGTAFFANNTIVTYAPTTYDIACWDSSCSNSALTFKNNITLAYDNPTTYNMGGQPGGTGAFYFQQSIGQVIRQNNIWYGMRATSFPCPTGNSGEMCMSPMLLNQPTGEASAFTETELDNFNFEPAPGSPAIGAGVVISGLTSDYTGAVRNIVPTIGAYEQ